MLTQEQQDALSGTGAYAPQLPPPSGSTFRPFPGEMGRPGSIIPGQSQQAVPGMTPNGDASSLAGVALFILLGMLG
jgi:hypothetical protein